MKEVKGRSLLPNNWESVQLGDICDVVEKTNRKTEQGEIQFYYLDINSIDNLKFAVVEPKVYKWKNAPSRAQQIVKTNDVLFSTVRPYLKNIATVPQKYDRQIASTGFCVIRPILTSPKFVFYFVLTSSFINSLNKLARGTSYPAVRNKDVFEQKIPIPPLPEQHRIVAKIEELFSELDNGIANLEKAKAQLKVYRQAVLKSAFEGKLTEQWRAGQLAKGTLPSAEDLLARIQEERQNHYEQQLTEWREAVAEWEANGKEGRKPSKPKKPTEYPPLTEKELGELSELPVGWKWVYIGFTGIVKGGKRLPKGSSFSESQTPFHYIMAGNLKGGTVKYDVNCISKEIYDKLINYRVATNDVYITIVGACIGDAGVIPSRFDKAILTENAAKIINLIQVKPKFLSNWLSSPVCEQYINQKILSATLGKLALSRIERLPLPICAIEEQHQIVQEIESRLSVCDHLEQEIETALQKSEALRQSILKKAFEGRLAPQDPAEEPAEVLLERIKVEKSQIRTHGQV